jgi:thiamine biosynthesis lipoprotein
MPLTPDARRGWVRVADVMGTAVSIRVVTDDPVSAPARAGDAVDRALARLRRADRVFSPFRTDSDISRMARGELAAGDAAPEVREMADLCLGARSRTGGRFDAWRTGSFDPTGLVKGWAVEEAARLDLAPLLEDPSTMAVGISAGGDMQLLTAPDAGWEWGVGIADPFHRGSLISTLTLREGAVATSGPAERGKHITDPRTGEPVTGVASATVVADGLTTADLWATVAVVAGTDDLGWIRDAGTVSGLLVAEDGRCRRWAGSRVLDPA